MDIQEAIKLIAAIMAGICILAGIVALFTGLKAAGEINLKGLAQGKIKTGDAGLFLLFFGTIILVALIMKGSSTKISGKPGSDSFIYAHDMAGEIKIQTSEASDAESKRTEISPAITNVIKK